MWCGVVGWGGVGAALHPLPWKEGQKKGKKGKKGRQKERNSPACGARHVVQVIPRQNQHVLDGVQPRLVQQPGVLADGVGGALGGGLEGSAALVHAWQRQGRTGQQAPGWGWRAAAGGGSRPQGPRPAVAAAPASQLVSPPPQIPRPPSMNTHTRQQPKTNQQTSRPQSTHLEPVGVVRGLHSGQHLHKSAGRPHAAQRAGGGRCFVFGGQRTIKRRGLHRGTCWLAAGAAEHCAWTAGAAEQQRNPPSGSSTHPTPPHPTPGCSL